MQKGVSAIIAIILLLMIVVAITSLAYIFFSLIFSQTTQSGTTAINTARTNMLTQMKIESMSINSVYIRNIGQSNLANLSVYVNDAPANFNMTPPVIKPGQTGIVNIYDFTKAGDKISISSSQGTSVTTTAPDPCSQAVACYKFDEGFGSTANDCSGNGNKGTIFARHENLLVYSNDFKNLVGGAWWWYGSGIIDNMVPNTPDTLAPDSTQTAVKFTSHGYGLGYYSGAVQNVATVDGATYTASIWLKGASGGEKVFVGFSDGEGSYYTLTTNWVRYSYTGTHLNVNGRGFQWVDATSGNVIYVWGAQLEKESNAGLYTATTNTAFNDGIIAYAGQFTPWTTGKFGGGLLLDGVDDYVNISDISLTNQITMELWFKSSATQNYKFLVEKENTTGTYLWGMYLTGNSTVLSTYIRSSADVVNTANINNGGPWNDSAWHHLVGTFDGRYIKIYADGSLTSTTDWGSAQNIAAGSGRIYIGAWPGNSQYFNGTIDEVRIYNKAIY